MSLKNIFVALSVTSVFLFGVATPTAVVVAGESKAKPAKVQNVYGEEEFLQRFQNRSRKQVRDVLGKPERIGQGSRPGDVGDTLGRPLDKQKVDNVEMWYYKNKVSYDDKNTYKIVELTFVNDRCLNITYFNQ